VNEFRDLRANPRCLVESQILSFRVRWARMAATGVLGAAAGRARGAGAFAAVPPAVAGSTSASPAPGQQRAAPASAPGAAAALGLTFDPYDSSALPARILATGAAINFPSVAQLVAEVLHAPVLLPTTQLDSAQSAPHRNAPVPGVPGRAAVGGAYVARWVWGRAPGHARHRRVAVRRTLRAVELRRGQQHGRGDQLPVRRAACGRGAARARGQDARRQR
jgi:xylulokinase